MAPRKRPVARELVVVFDTNPLFTSVPSDLVNADTRKLIQDHSAHADLRIKWILPEIVIAERHYQMKDQAEQLLPQFQKINALLGIGLTVTADTLSPKISAVIDAELAALKIERFPLDHARVEWQTILHNAAFRIAPFQRGKNEKGFRDAMVLESFAQAVEAAPTSPARCRLVLVTGDEHLTFAAKERISTHSNAEVLSGLEELRNLISTLISTVDESFVKDWREKAGKIFFEPAQTDTLYYRKNIHETIQGKYPDKLKELPDDATVRETDGIRIAPPQFLKKEQQRVHWSSRITFTANAYKYAASASTASKLNDYLHALRAKPGPEAVDALGAGAYSTGTPFSNFLGLGAAPPTGLAAGSVPSFITATSPSLLDFTAEGTKTLVKKGRTVFEVAWSTTVSSNKKLVRPKIDGISFVETIWSD